MATIIDCQLDCNSTGIEGDTQVDGDCMQTCVDNILY